MPSAQVYQLERENPPRLEAEALLPLPVSCFFVCRCQTRCRPSGLWRKPLAAPQASFDAAVCTDSRIQARKRGREPKKWRQEEQGRGLGEGDDASTTGTPRPCTAEPRIRRT